jgi:hypothetical protein
MDLEPLLRPFLVPGLLILKTQHSERQYHIGTDPMQHTGIITS